MVHSRALSGGHACHIPKSCSIGSIAGRRIDRKQSEAYHYSKDLQKSIVRQSVRIDKLHMNLLELLV